MISREDRAIAVVDLVVAGGDGPGQLVIDVDQRRDDAADLVRREVADRGHVANLADRRLLEQPACLLRDPGGVVADPLELERHVIERHQEAKVPRDRRLRRDRHHDVVRDLVLRLVDPVVLGDHASGEIRVAVDDRPDGIADLGSTSEPIRRIPSLTRRSSRSSATRDGGVTATRRTEIAGST